MILETLITDKIYNFYHNKGIEVILYGIGKKINLKLNLDYMKKIKYII